jgi:hypothetical protein
MRLRLMFAPPLCGGTLPTTFLLVAGPVKMDDRFARNAPQNQADPGFSGDHTMNDQDEQDFWITEFSERRRTPKLSDWFGLLVVAAVVLLIYAILIR